MIELKMQDNLTDRAFNKLAWVFRQKGLPSFKVARKHVEFLAKVKAQHYDCCINVCICYTGPHETKTECPFCKEPRLKSDGKPQKTFTYIPLIPRLAALFQDPNMINLMSYHHNYKLRDNIVQDIFDGSVYSELKGENVTIGGVDMGHKFFDGADDIALGLATDGFAPFKRRKQTCWPLIIFNYNLPPDIRFHLEHLLCAGAIPGPNKPKDADFFLCPLVNELLELAAGVKTPHFVLHRYFMMKAYAIVASGDIPAISMIMRIKGHNGLMPCRWCLIQGVRDPAASGNTYYVPLDRTCVPTSIRGDSPATYDATQLPMRTHSQFMEHTHQAQFAPSAAAAERAAKSTGVKGIPILLHLPSLRFPRSFPYDWMHLIYENLVKNLLLLWTATFKDLDHDDHGYHVLKTVWDAIGEATKSSKATIPAAYGAAPPDPTEERSQMTADNWSFWI
jgi:hypothetical protein